MDKLASVIIVSYNSLKYLQLCIDYVLNNTFYPYELIIIDNNSRDGTPAWLQKNETRIKSKVINGHIILNKRNKGYSQACNQGIVKAKGDYYVFLNSDILVAKNWLKRLIDHIDKDPAAGMVGPVGTAIGGEQNYIGIYNEYCYSSPFNGALEEFAEDLYSKYRGDYTESKFLIGCCLMLKKEVVQKVGLFDSNLFMSADDFDYSLRVRMAGYSLYVAEDVFVHHFDHKSFDTLSGEEESRYIKEGWERFRSKWKKILENYSMDDLFYNDKRLFFKGLVKGRRLNK